MINIKNIPKPSAGFENPPRPLESYHPWQDSENDGGFYKRSAFLDIDFVPVFGPDIMHPFSFNTNKTYNDNFSFPSRNHVLISAQNMFGLKTVFFSSHRYYDIMRSEHADVPSNHILNIPFLKKVDTIELAKIDQNRCKALHIRNKISNKDKLTVPNQDTTNVVLAFRRTMYDFLSLYDERDKHPKFIEYKNVSDFNTLVKTSNSVMVVFTSRSLQNELDFKNFISTYNKNKQYGKPVIFIFDSKFNANQTEMFGKFMNLRQVTYLPTSAGLIPTVFNKCNIFSHNNEMCGLKTINYNYTSHIWYPFSNICHFRLHHHTIDWRFSKLDRYLDHDYSKHDKECNPKKWWNEMVYAIFEIRPDTLSPYYFFVEYPHQNLHVKRIYNFIKGIANLEPRLFEFLIPDPRYNLFRIYNNGKWYETCVAEKDVPKDFFIPAEPFREPANLHVFNIKKQETYDTARRFLNLNPNYELLDPRHKHMGLLSAQNLKSLEKLGFVKDSRASLVADERIFDNIRSGKINKENDVSVANQYWFITYMVAICKVVYGEVNLKNLEKISISKLIYCIFGDFTTTHDIQTITKTTQPHNDSAVIIEGDNTFSARTIACAEFEYIKMNHGNFYVIDKLTWHMFRVLGNIYYAPYNTHLYEYVYNPSTGVNIIPTKYFDKSEMTWLTNLGPESFDGVDENTKHLLFHQLPLNELYINKYFDVFSLNEEFFGKSKKTRVEISQDCHVQNTKSIYYLNTADDISNLSKCMVSFGSADYPGYLTQDELNSLVAAVSLNMNRNDSTHILNVAAYEVDTSFNIHPATISLQDMTLVAHLAIGKNETSGCLDLMLEITKQYIIIFYTSNKLDASSFLNIELNYRFQTKTN